MVLLIDQPSREPCPLCRSAVERAGFTCQDNQGVRRHLCSMHVVELLRVVLAPLKAVETEA